VGRGGDGGVGSAAVASALLVLTKTRNRKLGTGTPEKEKWVDGHTGVAVTISCPGKPLFFISGLFVTRSHPLPQTPHTGDRSEGVSQLCVIL
jgi:hypothetical protein